MKKVIISVFTLALCVSCFAASAGRKVMKTVQPSYPVLAKQMRLSGTVKVEAVVSSSGKILDVKVIGGNPVLAQSAAEAAKKFLYEPAPSETTETISFNFVAE